MSRIEIFQNGTWIGDSRVARQFLVWFLCKARENAAQAGVYQAARNLRKQGLPLPYALAILVGRSDA